jgi:hypothetical protein
MTSFFARNKAMKQSGAACSVPFGDGGGGVKRSGFVQNTGLLPTLQRRRRRNGAFTGDDAQTLAVEAGYRR